MSEIYQQVIAIAAGEEAATALRSTLDALTSRLAAGTFAAAELPTTDEPAFPPHIELERVRREVVLGALASRWRHTLNNSLAAVLAEAQLLGMEPLPPEHDEAIQRIIALCRRMILVLRDGPRQDHQDHAETGPDNGA
jgi:signal transduction histidine kinase